MNPARPLARPPARPPARPTDRPPAPAPARPRPPASALPRPTDRPPARARLPALTLAPTTSDGRDRHAKSKVALSIKSTTVAELEAARRRMHETNDTKRKVVKKSASLAAKDSGVDSCTQTTSVPEKKVIQLVPIDTSNDRRASDRRRSAALNRAVYSYYIRWRLSRLFRRR
ncbi:hypothetical protein LSAT2_012078 [Lamellibrachia satsuma]|nr:hypothetical protein LSAT2_012078 [Lamellibrachia satsuma]